MTDSILSATGRSAAAEVGTRTMDVNRVRTDEYAASYARYLADRAARRPIRELVLDRDTPTGTITVSVSGNPRFDADGNFLGYRGATRNITAELQAREQARRSHELLQQALEGMPASVMISGPDGRILMANRRWHDSVGHGLPPDCDTWEAVIRHQVRCGHYPDAAGHEEPYVAWRLAQSSTQATPLEIRWKEHWALSADQRLADGSTVHLSIDISDRKRAEQALQRADERWRYALEGAGHGVWDWDRELGMYASPSLQAMLGYAEGELPLTASTWRSLLHRGDRARVLAEVIRHVRGGSATYEVEYRLRHRDGHYLWIHDRGRVLARDDQGRALRMVGTQSDITRLRDADQALRDKHAAEALSRRTSEFLARMSHEVRTPLNAVIGFAELLHLRGEYQAEQVEHILAAARHLLVLINDVLDLQQVEQGTLALREGPVDTERWCVRWPRCCGRRPRSTACRCTPPRSRAPGCAPTCSACARCCSTWAATRSSTTARAARCGGRSTTAIRRVGAWSRPTPVRASTPRSSLVCSSRSSAWGTKGPRSKAAAWAC